MRKHSTQTSSHPVRRRVVWTLLVLAGSLGAQGRVATADPDPLRYGMSDLGFLPGGYGYSIGHGINDAGDVVGEAYSSSGYLHAFLSSGGTMSDLGTLPGGTSSNASAINSAGQVVGASSTASGTLHAFLYSAGSMTDLGAFGNGFSDPDGNGYTFSLPSIATAVNDLGQAVGYSNTPAYPYGQHAFLYSGGTMTDLGTLPGGYSSQATGINDLGQVCGWGYTNAGEVHAFIHDGVTMTDIGVLPGCTSSYATGINDLGQVCGYGIAPSGYRSFVYSGGTMTDLGSLPGGADALAFGINDLGQVCGYGDTPLGYHSFLWSGGTMTDLGALPYPGGNYAIAQAINNSGQVAGYALSSVVGGTYHAFLASPIANDTTPPTIVAAPIQRRSANIDGQFAVPDFTGTVIATDDCTNIPLTITQSPAAGTIVGVGDTTVTVTVTDSAGNATNGTTTFTVILGVLPPSGPVSLYTGPGLYSQYADIRGIDGDWIAGYLYGVGPVVWDATAPGQARTTLAGNYQVIGISGDAILGMDPVTSAAVVWDANDPHAAPVPLNSGGWPYTQPLAIGGGRIVGWVWDDTLEAIALWDANDPTAGPVLLTAVVPWFETLHVPSMIDGDRIVGFGYDGVSNHYDYVVWDANDLSAPPVPLNVGNYTVYAVPTDVDGDRIVGYGYDGVSSHYDNIVWDASDPAAAPVPLGLPANGYLSNLGSIRISGDRIAAFGVDWNLYSVGVFVWDADDPAAAPQFLDLGPLLNPYYYADPYYFYVQTLAIDGDRIVGSGYESNYYGQFTFLVTAPSTRLVAPTSIVQECDDGAEGASVNFVFDVDPEEASLLRVVDVTGNRTLLEVANPAHQTYGVGPVTFPHGASSVAILLYDGTRLLDSASLTIQIEDTVAPVLTGCAAKTVELNGPLTVLTTSLLGISASDACDPTPAVNLTPGMVGLGTTSVTAVAADDTGNSTSSTFDVTVVDTTPPMFTVAPADIERACVSGGSLVSFDVLAEDRSGSCTLVCTDENGQAVDPAGTVFQAGAHSVTCTATDPSGNVNSYVFHVTIVDDDSPVIVVPADISVTAEPGVGYAFVSFVVTASDECDPSVALQIEAPYGPVQSGDAFLVGTTTITCTAVDHAGNPATATFNITVRDGEPPVLSGPASVTLLTDCAGSAVTVTAARLGVTATDNNDASVAIVVAPSSIGPGTTTVVCTATDDDGNQSQKSVQVTVVEGAFTVRFLQPLDSNVDNKINPGRTVPVKVRVTCDNVFDAGVTAVIDHVDRIDGSGTPIANVLVDDAGSSNDDGDTMRLADGFYVFNLSTTGWASTSGARFRVVVRVSKAGHVDSFGEVILKNK